MLEPVKLAYLTFPVPLQIFLPEDPLPEDAHRVAYLVGKQPDQVGGVWREIFVYRARRMVQVYRIESHGRRFYRSLEYASDARFCLRAMQPSTDNREQPWPDWERHGAGHPYEDSHGDPTSAVITREASCDENLSLGVETYIPDRLLWGIVPHTLLEQYCFWQDEDDHLRGYPIPKPDSKGSSEQLGSDIIFVRLAAGAHVALHGGRFDAVGLKDKLLTPTRALILRLKKARLQRQRTAVGKALALVEAFAAKNALLTPPLESSFAVSKALATILRRIGGHSFGPGSEGQLDGDLAALSRLLGRIDLLPFSRRAAATGSPRWCCPPSPMPLSPCSTRMLVPSQLPPGPPPPMPPPPMPPQLPPLLDQQAPPTRRCQRRSWRSRSWCCWTCCTRRPAPICTRSPT